MRLMPVPLGLPRPGGMVPRQPVSVCFVIDRLGSAGTETQLVALLRELDRTRVRPSLCLLNAGASVNQLPPVHCPVLDLGLTRLLSPAAAAAGARLAGFWRRQRVDVVVTYFLDSTYFAAPLARLCGIRRVVRVRNNVGYWLTPLHRGLGRAAGRLCHVTLTNSEPGRRSLMAAERLPANRVRVLENGVDVDRFAGAPVPDTARNLVRIGAVANLRPVKNIDGLVRVAAAICRADPRARFEVAGEGDQRSHLQRQIENAGIPGRFALRGTVEDVPRFLAALDVAVLASHSESMSNALLEYMAAGRAIVATDVGSNARLVRHGREGLVVPAGDDRALESAIRRLIDDPPLARSLGLAARKRAEAEFSRAAMVRRFEEFFASLMK